MSRARPAGLHLSALSPDEFEAYVPLVDAFEGECGLSETVETELSSIWAWLKPKLSDQVDAHSERQIVSLFRSAPSIKPPTTAAQTATPPSHLLLALVRLVAHANTSRHLTRDLVFIQTDPAELDLAASPTPPASDAVTSPPLAGATAFAGSASANPFRRSLTPLSPSALSSPALSAASSSTASPVIGSVRAISGQSAASTSGASSRGPPPPPPAKRLEPSAASASVSGVSRPNPFRQSSLGAAELPLSPPASASSSSTPKEWLTSLGRRPSTTPNGAGQVPPLLPRRPSATSPEAPSLPPRTSSRGTHGRAPSVQLTSTSQLPPPPTRRASLQPGRLSSAGSVPRLSAVPGSPAAVVATRNNGPLASGLGMVVSALAAPRTKFVGSSHIGVSGGTLRSTPSPLPGGSQESDGSATPRARNRSSSNGSAYTYEPAASPKRERGTSNASQLEVGGATSPFYRSVSEGSTSSALASQWTAPPLPDDALAVATAPLPSTPTFAPSAAFARREAIPALAGPGLARARTVGSKPAPPPPPKRRESLQASASYQTREAGGQNPFLASGGGSIVGYAPSTHASTSKSDFGASLARVPSAPSAVSLSPSAPAGTASSLTRHTSLSRSNSTRTNNAKQLGQDFTQLLGKSGKTGQSWFSKAAVKLPGVGGGDDPGLAMRRKRREERERLVSGGSARVVSDDDDDDQEEGDAEGLVEDEGFEARDARRRERAEAERVVVGSGVVGEGQWVPL